MNNNLIINNPSWIGSTHNDNYKTMSNFILTTSNILETHSSNFTLATSNILEDHIKISSNNNINYTYNTSNYFSSLINQQIKQINGVNYNHTYIINSNILGEIRFITLGTPIYTLNDNNNFITRILENGQLQCYYNYSFTHPTVLGGWYNVMDGIRDGYAYQATNNAVNGEVQFAINSINNQLGALIATTGSSLVAISGGVITRLGIVGSPSDKP